MELPINDRQKRLHINNYKIKFKECQSTSLKGTKRYDNLSIVRFHLTITLKKLIKQYLAVFMDNFWEVVQYRSIYSIYVY